MKIYGKVNFIVNIIYGKVNFVVGIHYGFMVKLI